MGVKSGDVVTVSVGPTINLSNYESLKPHASITRELGEDPEADLASMQAVLAAVFHHTLLTEVGLMTGARDALDRDYLSGLAQHCAEELGVNGIETTRRESEGTGPKKGTEKSGVRKARKAKSAKKLTS